MMNDNKIDLVTEVKFEGELIETTNFLNRKKELYKYFDKSYEIVHQADMPLDIVQCNDEMNR